MSKLTISAAAQAAGVSRTTLYNKYINTGKISVSEDARGVKSIDKSELLRVFKELKPPAIPLDTRTQSEHSNTLALQSENNRLRDKLEALQDVLKAKDDHINTLKNALVLMEHRPLRETPQAADISQTAPDQDSVLQRYKKFEELLHQKYAKNEKL